jgi:serine/threonine protein kinase
MRRKGYMNSVTHHHESNLVNDLCLRHFQPSCYIPFSACNQLVQFSSDLNFAKMKWNSLVDLVQFPITAIREIKILKKLQHENVIKLKEIVTSKGFNLGWHLDPWCFIEEKNSPSWGLHKLKSWSSFVLLHSGPEKDDNGKSGEHNNGFTVLCVPW